MRANPDHFFKYYPVMMAGGNGVFNPNAANPRTYYLGKKTGSEIPGDKEGHYGATRPGFNSPRAIASFKMDIFQGAGYSNALLTDGVPMVNYNSTKDGKVNLQTNIAAMDHYVASAGMHYMTTGLLTGCCFAWKAQGNDLWCVHVRPEGIDSIPLHNAMALHGRFTALPGQPLATFGRNDYVGSYAIVIGVNTATGWKLYAQTSGDQFKTLDHAWRLYPGNLTQLI